MSRPKSESLKRKMGATSLALNAMNLTIGAGIFVLPATVAAGPGAAGFIAYLLCGLLVILIMLCFAEAGSQVTSSGGVYAYVEAAFGPYFGFLISTLFWFGFSCIADAAVMNALANMLEKLYSGFGDAIFKTVFFFFVFAIIAMINIRGVSHGASLSVATILIKLIPLFMLIGVGILYVDSRNLTIDQWPSVAATGNISLILFFAFMGSESALSNSGEIREPQRNIPLGILLGILSVVVIYLLLQFTAQGVLGPRLATSGNAPLVALGEAVLGSVGGRIILFAAMVSMLGLISADILASPRVMYAAARDGLLPAAVARVHRRFHTPHIAIIVYSLIAFLFSAGLGFKALASLASSSVLIIYLAAILATIRLKLNRTAQQPGFKLPGGITIHLCAVAVIGWFLAQLTWPEARALCIFFVITSIVYFASRAVRKSTIAVPTK